MINGLFSDILQACANWFLYIFITADAPFNTSIMKKRSNQIAWLKRLDAINPTYNYNELCLIVQDGIVKKYGKMPADVLAILYNTAVGVNGVGSTISDEQTALATQKLNALSLPTTNSTTGKTEEKNFWTGMDDVLSFIKQILALLGIGKEADIKPTATEWAKPNSSSSSVSMSSIGDYLPWVVAAAIVIGGMSGGNKNKKSKKS